MDNEFDHGMPRGIVIKMTPWVYNSLDLFNPLNDDILPHVFNNDSVLHLPTNEDLHVFHTRER